MKVAVDLHIHSCLSPCAEDDMTPNNIINMALLKGLQIISVTDHNSTKNVSALIKAAEGKDILVLPGVEVQTREEVHLLCYFDSLSSLDKLGAFLYANLPMVDNNIGLFGHQFICDSMDEIIGEERKLLLAAVDLSINQLVDKVGQLGGVVVPAHIDRSSNSIVANLGFIPEELKFHTLEVSRNMSFPLYHYDKYQLLQSSDAHSLGAILEPVFHIDISEFSLRAIIHLLKNSRGTSRNSEHFIV